METITRFRFSCIWVETNLALLESEQPANAPLKFLGRPFSYGPEFNEMQHSLKIGLYQPVSTPWPNTKGQRFWHYYMEGKTNANVEGAKAWRKVVPFRTELPIQLGTDRSLSVCPAEIFFYPHGIAFVLTLTWESSNSVVLSDMLEKAFDFRYKPLYEALWEGGQSEPFGNVNWPAAPSATLTLSQLAEYGLSMARTAAYGPEARAGRLTAADPFTVFTVLNGKDVNLETAPHSDGEIHRSLHALTNWEKVRKGAATLTLDEKVKIHLGKSAGKADVLYGQDRGRAIWYPSRFTSDDVAVVFKLTCYHRNLVFASMQTESLCGFAEEMSRRMDEGPDLSSTQRRLARQAGSVLGLLYGGNKDTYRSLSPRRQMVQNDWVASVNAIRDYNKMPPLH